MATKTPYQTPPDKYSVGTVLRRMRLKRRVGPEVYLSSRKCPSSPLDKSIKADTNIEGRAYNIPFRTFLLFKLINHNWIKTLPL
jgi:hypothetical protein